MHADKLQTYTRATDTRLNIESVSKYIYIILKGAYKLDVLKDIHVSPFLKSMGDVFNPS